MKWVSGAICLLFVGLRTSAKAPAPEESTVLQRKIRPLEDIVKERGYPIEAYKVTTEDKYILTVHRIRHGEHGEETNKIPVMLQHGILDSSACFLAVRTSLAYYLADNGYDVWIGNARGTLYSRQHEELNPDKDNKYWDFSFHEMGMYDLPAVIKHIKSVTGVEKTHYIGMSMGSTMFLVMASMRPEFLSMMDCVILLAPVARPKHMVMVATKPRMFVNWAFIGTLNYFGVGEFLGHLEGPASTAHRLCSNKGWTGALCDRMFRTMSPKEMDLFDFDNAVDTIQYFPAGSTIKTYKHYLQIVRSGRFRQYNYHNDNKDHYEGSDEPPDYDLSKIKKRLYLIAGGLDNVSDPKDVWWLSRRLPDAVLILDRFKSFSHRDFLYGVNLEVTLYKTVDEIFRDHLVFNEDHDELENSS